MRLSGATILCAVMLMGAFASDAFAAPEPPVTGNIKKVGKRVVLSLDASAGDYLHGELTVTTGRFDLDVIDARGGHIRQLAQDATGTIEFRIMVGQGERLALTSTDASGAYELAILAHVKVADQKPPAVSYLSPTIESVARDVTEGLETDDFWKRVTEQGTPVVEPQANGNAIVTFLARGAKRNVRLFGGPSGDHENLTRIGQSDIWFASFSVPDSTRLSYRLAYDVPDIPGNARQQRVAILATAKADPFNRKPWPAEAADAFNQDSTIELANAPPQPWLQDKGNARGNLRSFVIASDRLGNRREITLYTPPDFDRTREDTVLLFVFDAKEYLGKVPTPRILDNMIAAGVIPPTVAVFIANPDRDSRSRELPGNDDFADFMALELLPRVRSETGLAANAARTVLAGSSYGGLASATVALRHPGAFGNVLSLSGSFWWHPKNSAPERTEYVASLVAGQKASADIRFFLSAGLFENGGRGTSGILDTTRHLRNVLEARGYPVIYRDYAAGHDYFAWRGALADGLLALFGK